MTIVVDEAQTLRQLTDNRYAQASFCWQYLMKNKEIKVNGAKVGRDMPLKAGDVVTYFLTEKQRNKSAFSLLFEDEQVCIIDKESGVNAEAVYAELSRRGEYYFLHRLDRNTCGLMVFAKTPAAEQTLLAAFRERKVEKSYRCLCFGIPVAETAVLTAYLKKDDKSARVTVYDTPVKGTEKIVTEYCMLGREVFEGEQIALLDVTLHTGKTHQIRAHLAHIGCPIVGDMKYGDSAKNRLMRAERQRLVAKRLRFFLQGELSYLNGKEFCSRFDVETI